MPQARILLVLFLISIDDLISDPYAVRVCATPHDLRTATNMNQSSRGTNSRNAPGSPQELAARSSTKAVAYIARVSQRRPMPDKVRSPIKRT
ncbi:hypothetical protein C8Q70DRAFT_330536 [Cubamyces menziesii]|nr:hypothetical protein C8Q70DRAFT_330536 [Cubamyces menziesii]